MTQPPSQIPAAEYPQRWRAVQDLLERIDVDLLLAYADDRAVFGPAHAPWLANFPPLRTGLRRPGAHGRPRPPLRAGD